MNTNLLNWLYDQMGEESNIADSKFVEFISNRIDDESLEGEIDNIEVPDDELEGYLIAFKEFIQE